MDRVKFVWVSYGVLLILAVYGMLGKQIQVWDGYGAFYSVADCLAAACRPDVLFLGYLALTIVLILNEEESRLKSIFIVPFVFRKRVWCRQCMRVMRTSLYCSSSFAGITVVLGALSSPQWMNWDDGYSIYFSEVRQLFQGNFLLVAGLFLFFIWFKTVFFVLTLLALEWWGIKKIYGWIGMMSLFIVEWVNSRIMLFFRLFSIRYLNFKYWYGMVGICILTCLLFVLVYKVGEAGADRKEIYHG